MIKDVDDLMVYGACLPTSLVIWSFTELNNKKPKNLILLCFKKRSENAKLLR